MSVLRDFNSARIRSGTPVTTAIVVLIVLGFMAGWMDASGSLVRLFVFQSDMVLSRPWILATYPFVTGSPISVLFSAMWIWGIGGVVEREEGSVRYAWFWVGMSVVCAIGLLLGSVFTGYSSILSCAWTPAAALTIVWGTRHPGELMQFMFVLPITARWMAWLSVALVFFGTLPPAMAPFAAAPLALAWLFAARRLPSFGGIGGGGAPKKGQFVRGAGFYSKEYFDEVKRREQDRAEKERLRKLFEGSREDDGPKGR